MARRTRFLARTDNCGGKAAFEKALFVYPEEQMRQGARITLKSMEPAKGK